SWKPSARTSSSTIRCTTSTAPGCTYWPGTCRTGCRTPRRAGAPRLRHRSGGASTCAGRRLRSTGGPVRGPIGTVARREAALQHLLGRGAVVVHRAGPLAPGLRVDPVAVVAELLHPRLLGIGQYLGSQRREPAHVGRTQADHVAHAAEIGRAHV